MILIVDFPKFRLIYWAIVLIKNNNFLKIMSYMTNETIVILFLNNFIISYNFIIKYILNVTQLLKNLIFYYYSTEKIYNN